jgi:thiamine-monophosphate kinase
LDACSLALAGGEDYELLFTVPPRKHRRFERLASQTDFRFTRIGAITGKGTGLRLRSHTGMSQRLPHASYEHFLRPS